MERLKLRKATIKDLKLIDCFQDKLVNYERKLDPLIRKGKNIRFYPEKEIKRMLCSSNSLFLIAEINNNVVGCGVGKIEKTFGNWCVYKKRGYIGHMFVDENYRRKGIGKKIMSQLIKWFKSKKIKFIRLCVYANNQKTINAYRKYGFKDYTFEMKL